MAPAESPRSGCRVTGRAVRARASGRNTVCTAELPPPTEPPLCTKRKIMYVHFSKTAGSILCYLAKRSGCRCAGRQPIHAFDRYSHRKASSQLHRTFPATIERNCASRTPGFQDGPWWVPTIHSASRWIRDNFAIPGPVSASKRYSCADRLAMAPQFHAVESTLPAGRRLAQEERMDCDLMPLRSG